MCNVCTYHRDASEYLSQQPTGLVFLWALLASSAAVLALLLEEGVRPVWAEAIGAGALAGGLGTIAWLFIALVFLGFFGVVCAWGCQTTSAAARILIKRTRGER